MQSDTQAPTQVDVLVIGGGVNGAGIARDAVGRGLSVVLCEKDDLAQHTSSASTKLIHGGLRYLEHYDFSLVRHALIEREVLLRNAPHIIWPLRFILPHHRALRPRWMIRLGLFLYDHLGGRKRLPASHGVSLKQHVSGRVLRDEFTHGFEYSDCWVQDARLVVLNALDAKERGGQILTRTQCVGLERRDAHWVATLRDQRNNGVHTIQCRSVVNAGGPWVEKILNLSQRNGQGDDTNAGVRLVKGSHIVVPQLFAHEFPYIFQNADDRILFAIPYEHKYTLLGTTDVEIGDEPGPVSIDEAEIDYLCQAANEYFKVPVSPSDVVWTYSGVRPLYDDNAPDASKVTRDYVLKFNADKASIVSVFGGKITTYRRLAEEVVDMLMETLVDGGGNKTWTADASLPGGDLPDADFDAFLAACTVQYAFLPSELVLDLARNYGTRIHTMLNGCEALDDMGQAFGPGLYELEVRYLIENEWAETVDDVLWRRTKKGLHAPPETVEALDRFFQNDR